MGKLDPHEPDHSELRFVFDNEMERLAKLKTYL